MADVTSAYGLLIFYMIFIGFLTFIVGMGAPQLLGNVPKQPAYPTYAPTGLEYIGWALFNIGWFITLLGITATTYPILGIFIGAMSVAIFYMVIRLVRGGG
jgi:hypothetical protein